MENELNTQFVSAFNEANDEELEAEKNMIKKFISQNNTLSLKHLKISIIR